MPGRQQDTDIDTGPDIDTAADPGSDASRQEPPAAYRSRRAEIAALAAGLDRAPDDIVYTSVENHVWATVVDALDPMWERHGASAVLHARDRLDLPVDRVPQLREVNETLGPATGFEYRAVPGLVPSLEFFGGLGRELFSSTQYVRWEGSPLYTPEPDVIHEVFGHANCLACPQIADLHRLAGQAMERVHTDAAREVLADLFWFSAEFGVIREPDGVRAYGAGLLSSVGELAWFTDNAEIRPLDLTAMATLDYEIDVFQPVLFAGESVDHVLDVVGGFFAEATDESATELIAPT